MSQVPLRSLKTSSLWVSRTDWCAHQEALYKCIDTIQYNVVPLGVFDVCGLSWPWRRIRTASTDIESEIGHIKAAILNATFDIGRHLKRDIERPSFLNT